MTRRKLICFCSAILAFFILFSLAVLTGNSILSNVIMPLGPVIALVSILCASFRSKNFKIHYRILSFACLAWFACDIFTSMRELAYKMSPEQHDLCSVVIVYLSFIVDAFVAITLIKFYLFRKKLVNSFQLIWNNISIFECSLGFLWIMFINEHYQDILSMHFNTIISFLYILLSIFILATLFSIYLSSINCKITMIHRFLMAGLAISSLTDLIQALLVQYYINNITYISYMLSLICIAIGGLLEIYNPLSGGKKIKLETYGGSGSISIGFFLFVVPILVVAIKGFDPYQVFYFVLVILTHHFVSIYVQKTSKIQQLLNEEKEISRKYELLAKAIEQSPVSIVITDINGRIEFCNHHFMQLTGKSKEEILSENISIVKSDSIDGQILYELRNRIKSGQTWRGEFVHEGTNEEKKISDLIIEPIKGKDNIITNYIFIGEDITELKKKEEKLKEAVIIAEEATKAKSMFLANMSHEIRTPMNAIIGMAYLALKTELTDKQRNYISKIHDAGTSLLGIVNDILDFSKIESGKLSLESTDFSIDDVVENICNIIYPNAFNKEIEFLVYINPNTPENLLGDSLRLGQVITNLLSNAVKFTESGEVSLEVEKICETDNKVQLQFVVKDTGIGILNNEIGKLFEAFTQADGSTTRKYGGTGLGLTISKKLVEMMDGSIWVESEYGKGSTFKFTAWFETSQINSNHRTVPAEMNNLHVLVVDDNLSSREIIGEYLKSMSFRVDIVSEGIEAAAAVKHCDENDAYAVVLIDYKIPHMNGIETAYIIKEDRNIKNKPRIIMIADFECEEISRIAKDSKIDGHLIKPVNPSNLYDILMNVFSQNTESERQDRSWNTDYKISGIRLLLAEDSEINRQVIIEVLQSQEIVIDTAINGKEAVTKVMENIYDILLMDLHMLEVDGFEAAKLIRGKNNSVPIIALTAGTMQEKHEKCIAEGINDFISKPIDPHVLFSTIHKWLPDYNKNEQLVIQKEDRENICMDKLKSLLKDSDSEAVDYFDYHRSIFLKCFNKETFRLIETSLNNFDFDKVIRVLNDNYLETSSGEG